MKGILSNIDPLDVDDFLTKVEKSFEINFSDDDLQLNTFGELLDSVINKLSLKNEIEDRNCTSHHLFNKTKRILIDKKISTDLNIRPKTNLNKIFPLIKRRKFIKLIEKELGLKLEVLTTPMVYTYLVLLNFIFLISNFFHDLFSISHIIFGLTLFIVLFLLNNSFTLVFKDKTFGELIKRIERENYISIRNDKKYFNPIEVEKSIKALFKDEFGLNKIRITRETVL